MQPGTQNSAPVQEESCQEEDVNESSKHSAADKLPSLKVKEVAFSKLKQQSDDPSEAISP